MKKPNQCYPYFVAEKPTVFLAYVATGILITLFILTLTRIVRTARSNLLIGLITLLIITNISFVIWFRGYR
jgi:hypothetical protein